MSSEDKKVLAEHKGLKLVMYIDIKGTTKIKVGSIVVALIVYFEGEGVYRVFDSMYQCTNVAYTKFEQAGMSTKSLVDKWFKELIKGFED